MFGCGWLPFEGLGVKLFGGWVRGSVMHYPGGNRGKEMFSCRGTYSGEEGLFDTEFNTVRINTPFLFSLLLLGILLDIPYVLYSLSLCIPPIVCFSL